MPLTAGERLARVLDGSPAPGAFSALLSVPARDVRLTVAGAGPISLPVKALQAKRMRPANPGAAAGRAARAAGVREGAVLPAAPRLGESGPPARTSSTWAWNAATVRWP